MEMKLCTDIGIHARGFFKFVPKQFCLRVNNKKEQLLLHHVHCLVSLLFIASLYSTLLFYFP